MTHGLKLSYSYPEIFPLSALIACNAMNWPGGAAIYLSHKFHHWLMLYTLGQYIVNVQWSMASEGFLTIFKFGIRYLPHDWYPFSDRWRVTRWTHVGSVILSRNFPFEHINCNAMNWPGGTAIYYSHKFHHWLMCIPLASTLWMCNEA